MALPIQNAYKRTITSYNLIEISIQSTPGSGELSVLKKFCLQNRDSLKPGTHTVCNINDEK